MRDLHMQRGSDHSAWVIIKRANTRMGNYVAALAAATLVGQVVPSASIAQPYPSQQIRIIVPFGPGGGPDVVARIVATELSKKYGVAAFVENKPGANGQIAAQQLRSSAPDGYTLFVANSGILAINPNLYKNLPYDPNKDFVPITQMIEIPVFLYAHSKLKVNTVTELIALIRGKPGVINYASAGHGSVHHMCTALFLNLNKLDAVHVPYKESSGIPTAMMSDQVELACSGRIQAQPIVDAGKAKPVVVALDKRSQLEPTVPTLREITGIDGFEIGSRVGMLAPAGVPSAVVAQLSKDISGILQSDQMRSRLTAQGVEVAAHGPESYARLIRREQEQFAQLIKIINETSKP